jgi:thiopeptide-type bacteriocin biosynthesis protein
MTPRIPFDASFAVFRIPRCEVGEFFSLDGSEKASATLARQLEREEVREALYLASRKLLGALEKATGSEKDRRRALASAGKYLARMVGRPTPFGLFAGVGVARLDDATEIPPIGPHAFRRTTRIDMGIIGEIFRIAERAGAAVPSRRVALNSSWHRSGGRGFLTETEIVEGMRKHRLVEVKVDPALRGVLEVLEAMGGEAGLEDLDGRLVTDFSADDPAAVARYIDELLRSQVLVTAFDPLITGEEPVDDLLRACKQLTGHEARRLRAKIALIRERVAALDRRNGDRRIARYEAIRGQFEEIIGRPLDVVPFQVDLFVQPPRTVQLNRALAREALAALEPLCELKLADADEETPLEAFARRFRERYEEAEVPLLAVLNPETGIGFGTESEADAENSPLLRDLPLRRRNGQPGGRWSRLTEFLAEKLLSANGDRAELVLTGTDMERLRQGREASDPWWSFLPDAFSVMIEVEGAPESVDAGDYALFLEGAGGPSGARLLGRFAHLDHGLRKLIRGHLRAEELCHDEAIFAEIVHLPAGRTGNVLRRPLLREYEIPFLGRSGAPVDHRLSVSDLRVRVDGAGKVHLRSAQMDREIVPRMTTAHNFWRSSLSVYHFLCSLQAQSECSSLAWTWGPFAKRDYLPRIRFGRTVLAKARWRISTQRSAELAQQPGALETWRREAGLPRFVTLGEGDQHLMLDLDDPLGIACLRGEQKKGRDLILFEVLPCLSRLLFAGAHGGRPHQIILPFARSGSRSRSAGARGEEISREARVPRLRARDGTPRCYPPGSEWIYLKLYGGPVSVERALLRASRVLREHAGQIEKWFFIRYGDPEWHIRLRVRSRRDDREQVRACLEAEMRRLVSAQLLWRVQVDTYIREVERYGGREGILLAEDIFAADSVFVARALASRKTPRGERWRLAAASVLRLLLDLRQPQLAMQVARHARDSYLKEFGGRRELRIALDRRAREERGFLLALFEEAELRRVVGRTVARALRERSASTVAALAAVERKSQAGCIEITSADFVGNVIHMAMNRLLMQAPRPNELVVYHMIAESLESANARGWLR